MAHGDVAGERVECAFVEYLRHQSHVLEHQDLLAVRRGDARALLASVLECVQAKVRELGYLFAWGEDAKDAAGILRALFAWEKVVREPSVASAHYGALGVRGLLLAAGFLAAGFLAAGFGTPAGLAGVAR